MSLALANVVFASLLLIFGIVYYGASANIPSNLLEDPVGASGYPRLVAAVMIGLATIILLQSLVKWRRTGFTFAPAAPVAGADDGEASVSEKFRKTGLLFVTIVAFLALFDVLGYIPAVSLLLLAVFLQSGTRFSWRPVVIAIAGAIFFHLMFSELLGVRFPNGMFSVHF